MKSALIGITCATLLAAALAFGAQKQDDAERQLKAAMNTELVDGNLKAAIEQYKKVAQSHNRTLAAQALIHMAECYQKMGDGEARKIYERVVQEYGDQKEAAAQARARLGIQLTSNTGGNTRQVWTKVGGNQYGPVSGDGRYLAFRPFGAAPNLVVHDFSTGADLVVTKNENPLERGASKPAFSPDSKQIAYVWFGERNELRIAELNKNASTNARVLLKSDDAFRAEDWSADGKWIALQFKRKDHTNQLGVVSTLDGTLRIFKTIDWEGSNQVYFSPDSRYLAFDLPSGENSDKRDIFVLTADGGREIPAMIHPANDRVAGWAPDGKHLLFISDRNGRDSLWWLPFESGKPQGNPEMLRPNFGGNDFTYMGPTRSGELYFLVHGGGVKVSVASVDFGTGKIRPGTMEQFTGNIYPAWSADGKYLAYSTYEIHDGKESTFLTVHSLETGQKRELRPALKYPTWPSWSPDGRSLLVQGSDLKDRWGVFKVDARTAEVEPIAMAGADAGFATPQWLPDGKRIVYQRVAARNLGGLDSAIVERELSSGKESEIVRVKSLPNQQSATRGFLVSPDGQSIAYLTANGPKAHTLLLMPLAGGPSRELMKLDQFVFLGGWTPDGQSLLLSRSSSQDNKATAKWLLPINGGPLRQLDLDENFATQLQANPDGKRIAFWSNNQTGEQIWVLENFLPSTKETK